MNFSPKDIVPLFNTQLTYTRLIGVVDDFRRKTRRLDFCGCLTLIQPSGRCPGIVQNSKNRPHTGIDGYCGRIAADRTVGVELI